MKKKPTFRKNILALDRLLLFSRVADPAGRRDCRFWHNVKEKVTTHPFNPNLCWQMLCICHKVSKCKSDTTWPEWFTQDSPKIRYHFFTIPKPSPCFHIHIYIVHLFCFQINSFMVQIHTENDIHLQLLNTTLHIITHFITRFNNNTVAKFYHTKIKIGVVILWFFVEFLYKTDNISKSVAAENSQSCAPYKIFD